MSRFRRKKKTEEAFELCEGVRLLNQPEISDRKIYSEGHVAGFTHRSRDSRGIWAKSILEVLIVGGSMYGFLSTVDMSYGLPIILIAYMMLALYFSGLFRSGKTWVRDVGYIIFFVFFVAFVVLMRKYINSGFYAIVNSFLDHVTGYYGASEVKVFSEAVSNRSFTVPVAAVAIGCIEIIILNIFLNTNMSVFWAFWFSVPIFILPLFFRLEPDILSVFMITGGLLGVICLKGNGHFRITDNDDTFMYDRKRRRMTYRHSDKASLGVVGWITGLCIIVTLIVMMFVPLSAYTYRYRDSSVKNKIEGPLGNLIMYGFESLRNTANTGGLAGGQLGGVSDVSFDGETDLTIRFAPYSTDRIYLKSFTGDNYNWDHWDKDADGTYPVPEDTESGSYGRMDIQNVDGMSNLLYYPYYTICDAGLEKVMNEGLVSSDAGGLTGYDDKTHTLSVEYAPYAESEPVTTEVDEKYLEVPEINIHAVEEFCTGAGVSESDSESERISKVYDYFAANYPYTLHPGATPRDEDYVNYFLQTTKKGLCANYATAGAIILRYLGIPTRYVEGYAMDYADVLDGEMLDEDTFRYDNYFTGDSKLGRTAVVDVQLDDSCAHAWIEAFVDGRWQVVELTPPSDEDEDESQDDFWSRFGRWLAGDGDTAGVSDTNGKSFVLNEHMWILYVLLGVICTAVILWAGRIAVRKIVRVYSYHGKDREENVLAYYRYMCNCARLSDVGFARAASHSEQLALLCPDMYDQELEQWTAWLEEISYGGGRTGTEYGQRMKNMKNMLREYRRRMPFIKRIYIFIKL